MIHYCVTFSGNGMILLDSYCGWRLDHVDTCTTLPVLPSHSAKRHYPLPEINLKSPSNSGACLHIKGTRVQKATAEQ